MREWRLRTSLMLMLVATTIVTFVIIAIVILIWRLPGVNQDMMMVAQKQSIGVARVVEKLLDGFEQRVQIGARLLDNQTVPMQRVLDALIADPTIAAAYVVGGDGRVKSLSLIEASREQTEALLNMDLSATALFRSVQQGQAAAWSDRYLSVLSAQPTVGLAIPLSHGVLIAELDATDLARTINSISDQTDGVVLIADSRGDHVSGHDLDSDGQYRNWGADLKRLEATLGGGQAYIEINRASHYAGLSRSPKLGWSFLVALPAHWQNPRYRTTLMLVVGGFFGSLLVGALIAPWWARLMSRPLRAIIRRTQQMADGQEVGERLPQGRITELNRLADNLQRMANVIKEREAAVRLSEERLRATVETTPSLAIQWYDQHGVAVYWNRASELFYGYTADEAIGRRIDELIVSPELGEQFRAGVARIADSGEVIGPIEFPCRHKDGHQVDTLCTVFAIPDPVHGRLFACMDVDISAVRQAEQALRQLNSELEARVAERTGELESANHEVTRALGKLQLAQRELVQSEKLAALGSLVAGIAHELNTPIGNGVMAVTTLHDQTAQFRGEMAAGLKRSSLESFVRNVEDATRIASRNLERAAELVSSFKQVAVDQTSSQRRSFELSEVVDEIVVTLHPTLKRTPFVLRQIVPLGLVLDSYPGPLGQVLANLINNALRHGLDGLDEGEIVIAAHGQDEKWIVLSVADNGKGIVESMIPRIFEPFVTTRLGSGGTGLGLHIVYNIVSGVLGGRIDVSSIEGKGATFTLTLPRVAPQVTVVDA